LLKHQTQQTEFVSAEQNRLDRFTKTGQTDFGLNRTVSLCPRVDVLFQVCGAPKTALNQHTSSILELLEASYVTRGYFQV